MGKRNSRQKDTMKYNPINGIPVGRKHPTAWERERLIGIDSQCGGLGCRYCVNGVYSIVLDTRFLKGGYTNADYIPAVTLLSKTTL